MKKTICTAVFLIMAVTGCMDAFLTKEPKDSLAPENFYETETDAISAIRSVYEPLGTPDYYNRNILQVLDNASDEARPFGADQERIAIDEYTNTSLNTLSSGWWQSSFQIVNRANAVTERVPDIDMDPDLRAGIVGEAKFLRALAYFNLVRMFGEVPVITQETRSFEDVQKPRASVDSIYAQIISDLQDAEQVLPESQSTDDQGRATLGAAKSLLAKVYLTRQEWQAAADKAKEVIDSGIYGLYEDYAQVFLPEFENGTEHIFSIQFECGLGGGKQGEHWTYTAPNDGKTGGRSIAPGSSFGAIFPEQAFFDEYPDDYRKEVNFFTEWTFPDSTTVTFEPHFLKFRDPNACAARQASTNYPFLRYADVLLMYAEAINEVSSPTPEAYNAINQVRQRARFGQPDSVLPDLAGLTQDQFRDAVLQERHWELAGEGKRWFDLKRTGRLISELTEDGKNIQERNLLFPLPSIELELNEDWQQNPGY